MFRFMGNTALSFSLVGGVLLGGVGAAGQAAAAGIGNCSLVNAPNKPINPGESLVVRVQFFCKVGTEFVRKPLSIEVGGLPKKAKYSPPDTRSIEPGSSATTKIEIDTSSKTPDGLYNVRIWGEGSSGCKDYDVSSCDFKLLVK